MVTETKWKKETLGWVVLAAVLLLDTPVCGYPNGELSLASIFRSCNHSDEAARIIFCDEVNLTAWNPETLGRETITPCSDVRAMDVHVARSLIFWIESSEGIKRGSIDGDNVTILIRKDEVDAYALAIDWISDQMYWSTADAVMAADLDGINRRTLFSAQLVEALAVHPKKGYIFWTGYINNGETSIIERATLDGQGRTRLPENVRPVDGSNFVIDFSADRLYYAGLESIMSVDYDGANIQPLVPEVLQTICYLCGTLYWLTQDNTSSFLLQKLHEPYNGTVTNLLVAHRFLTGLTAFHSSRQPVLGHNENVSDCPPVTVPHSAPVLDPAYPKNKTVVEGQSVSLQCRFTANPVASVTWKKLEEPDRKFPAGAQLKLSTTRFDAGSYQCVVENQFGSSASAVVHVSVHSDENGTRTKWDAAVVIVLAAVALLVALFVAVPIVKKRAAIRNPLKQAVLSELNGSAKALYSTQELDKSRFAIPTCETYLSKEEDTLL